jgi:hypothetical protein
MNKDHEALEAVRVELKRLRTQRLVELREAHPDWTDAEVCLIYMKESRTGVRHVGDDPLTSP